MSRYGPSVLAQPASPLAGFLGGVQEGIERKRREEAENQERERANTLFQLQLASMGAQPTAEFERTSRPTQARSVLATELAPGMAAAATMGDYSALMSGAGRAASKLQQMAGPRTETSTVFQRPADGARGPTEDEGTPSQVTTQRQPNAREVASYLNYQDRGRGMQPYRVGQYTVDPMVAYDRSRAAARQEDQELADQLGDVQLTDPAATALMRAGRVREAIALDTQARMERRYAEDRAGLDARAGLRSSDAAARRKLESELGHQRIEAALRGQDVTLYRGYLSERSDLEAKIASEGLQPGDPGYRTLSSRIADLTTRMNALRQRAGLAPEQ